MVVEGFKKIAYSKDVKAVEEAKNRVKISILYFLNIILR